MVCEERKRPRSENAETAGWALLRYSWELVHENSRLEGPTDTRNIRLRRLRFPRSLTKIFGHGRTSWLTERGIVSILWRTQASTGMSPLTQTSIGENDKSFEQIAKAPAH